MRQSCLKYYCHSIVLATDYADLEAHAIYQLLSHRMGPLLTVNFADTSPRCKQK